MFALCQFDKVIAEKNTWHSGFLEEVIFELDLKGWVGISCRGGRGDPGQNECVYKDAQSWRCMVFADGMLGLCHWSTEGKGDEYSSCFWKYIN